MTLNSREVFGAVKNTDGIAFAIRENDIVYPFLVTTEALQDAAIKNGDDPNDDLLEIWESHLDKIIEVAARTFELPQAVEQYVINTEELNDD